MKRKITIVAVFIGLVVAAGSFYLVREIRGPDGGIGQPVGAAEGRWTIDDARAFTKFPLYWLGQEFGGLPLTEIIRNEHTGNTDISKYNVEDVVVFIYGDCTPKPGYGCPIPLSVGIEPYCSRPPELLAGHVKSGPAQTIRGVEAQATAGAQEVILWTGNVRVTILTEQEGLIDKAAEALAPITSDGPAAGEPLSPADPNQCTSGQTQP